MRNLKVEHRSLYPSRLTPVGISLGRLGLLLANLGVLKDWLLSGRLDFPYSREILLDVAILTPVIAFRFLRGRLASGFIECLVLGASLFVSPHDQAPIVGIVAAAVFSLATNGLFYLAGTLSMLTCIAVSMESSPVSAFLVTILSAVVGVLGIATWRLAQADWARRFLRVSMAITLFLAAVICFAQIFRHPLDWIGAGLNPSSHPSPGTSVTVLGILPTLGVMIVFLGEAVPFLRKDDESTLSSWFSDLPKVAIGLAALSLICGHTVVSLEHPSLVFLCWFYVSARTAEVDGGSQRIARSWAKRGLVISPGVILTLLAFFWWRANSSAETIVGAWLRTDPWSQSNFLQWSEIASPMKDVTVATEDREFYDHGGFDFVAIHRALRLNLRAGSIVQGGSTISQQAARYTFLTLEKTFDRKVREAALTASLERHLSKDEILTLYMNRAYYGHNQVGLSSAAQFYFNKRPKDLTLSECLFLAASVTHPAESPSQMQGTLAFRKVTASRLFCMYPDKYFEPSLAAASVLPARVLFARSKWKVQLGAQ